MKAVFAALAAMLVSATPVQASPDANLTANSQEPGPAAAPDSVTLQLARDFVAMTSTPDVAEQQFVDQLKAMVLVMPGQDLAPGSAAELQLDETLSAARPAVRRHLPAVAEAVAQAYARTYSAEELRQLIAFANSPVGKWFVSETAITLDPAVTAAGKLLMEDAGVAMTAAARIAACQRATARRVAAGDIKARCPLA